MGGGAHIHNLGEQKKESFSSAEYCYGRVQVKDFLTKNVEFWHNHNKMISNDMVYQVPL